MSGVVSFELCSSEDTEVTLKIRSIFDPPSLSQRLEEYLELLRCFCLFTSTHRLVHISELVDFRVKRTEGVAKGDDMIWAKWVGVNGSHNRDSD
jgi:hypothetical protein